MAGVRWFRRGALAGGAVAAGLALAACTSASPAPSPQAKAAASVRASAAASVHAALTTRDNAVKRADQKRADAAHKAEKKAAK